MSNPPWYKWLQACSRDHSSPSKIAKGSLGMITGQDFRALAAVAACWELYSNSDSDGQRAALAAVRELLPAMQTKCLFFARELIAFAMNWDDRDHLWMLVTTEEKAPRAVVSSAYVLNQLAGMSFPEQGAAHHFMKRCFEEDL